MNSGPPETRARERNPRSGSRSLGQYFELREFLVREWFVHEASMPGITITKGTLAAELDVDPLLVER
jgi:hypothetical protein